MKVEGKCIQEGDGTLCDQPPQKAGHRPQSMLLAVSQTLPGQTATPEIYIRMICAEY